MIFELPDKHKNPDVTSLQDQLGIQISIKSKANPELNESTSVRLPYCNSFCHCTSVINSFIASLKSVIVKGPEYRITEIFQVRQHFLFESDSELDFIGE